MQHEQPLDWPCTRRRLLTAPLAAGAALTASAVLPGRVFASATSLSPEHRKLVDRAQAEISRLGNQLWRTDKVGMVDFNLPSSQPRLFIADMLQGSVRSFLVAHGRGSDPEHDGWLKNFSAQPGSLATSRGAYLTMDWYHGRYGASMRLGGLDADNHTAFDRSIVLHEAWYSNPNMIDKWGKLGRSEGCFAVSEGLNQEMLYHLGGGRLLFADKL